MLRTSSFAALALSMAGIAQAQSAHPWDDQTLPAPARAQMVLSEMTLDEKIAMVNGNFGSARLKLAPADKRIGAGYVPGVPRLGIPDLFETDGSVGVATGGWAPGAVATAFPANLAVAASFDPAFAFQSGQTIGAEARARGFNVLLGGAASLIRDPWNGRNFEYYSEDPLLTGLMAGEAISGAQSNGIISTAKHYALNAQESGRYVLNARIAEQDLRESDLLAFQIAIERGHPGSVMCGYNKVNGDWGCENHALLTDALKTDWHFDGWVMSDWGAVHSTAKAALAGLDQESGQGLDAQPFFAAPLKAAVDSGAVPLTRLDDMVRRILTPMFAHGLIDRPSPAVPEKSDFAAHAKVAQQIAEAGIVLLKNEGNLLPLKRTGQRILVIGAHSDVGVLSGGGSSQVPSVSGMPIRSSMRNGPPELSFIKKTYTGSSPLDALRAAMPDAAISYADPHDPATAAAMAKTADLVILFADQWRTEAFDVRGLALPDGQDGVIDAVATANPRSIVVLETGGAVSMPWLGKVGAVVEAWYPGERGGEAIASVLLGDSEAGGRLPVTFPQSADQAPRPAIPGLDKVERAARAQRDKKPTPGVTTVDISGGVEGFDVDYAEGADVGYRWYQRTHARPLFPFGYGLSYTHFTYRDLVVRGGKQPQVSFEIRNDGLRAGSDVPQVYASVAGKDGMRIDRLVGFQRVTLDPGASRRVTIVIDPRLVSHYDVGRHRWTAAAGSMKVSLRRNAEESVLAAPQDR